MCITPEGHALAVLVRDRVHFCVVGRYGLYMYGAGVDFPEIDLLIDNSWANIRRCVGSLKEQGFTISFGDQPAPDTLNSEFLDGKGSFVARKGELAIVCTYEYKTLNAADIINQARVVWRIPIAQYATLKEMIRLRGLPQDVELIEYLDARA